MDGKSSIKRLVYWLTPADISPRIFWGFQAIFWFAVFAWRTVYTWAYGYGFKGVGIRTLSIFIAIAITLAMAKLIASIQLRGRNILWISIVTLITCAIGILHTAIDRLIYVSHRNGWTLQPLPQEEFFQILSVNAWVFLSWVAFFFVILQFTRLRERDSAIQELTQIAKDAKLQTLMQQLNPHFLFNTLNSLSALISDKRNEDADRMVFQLARFLRHVIDSDHENKTALSSEINMTRDYLAIQKVRLQDRLEFSINCSAECKGAQVPVLILQPIVENAIKHGLDPITSI